MDLTNATRDELLAVIADLQTQVVALQARVKELEDRLALDSHNSSKPPSSDSGRPHPRSLRQPSGKRPGGQPGHPGHTLRLSETPDRVIEHRPSHCGACGMVLADVAPTGAERRQVVDLPPLTLEVVEHRAQQVPCPRCGQMTPGSFPPEVAQPVQYGPRLLGLGVYLVTYQLLPYDRTHQLLGDLFGAAPTSGTVQAAVERCAAGLVEVEGSIKEALRTAQVAHFDESGCYVGGKRFWVHVACTQWLTHYAWHPKRGKEATDAIGILPQFRGCADHDGWVPYWQYVQCRHALCNAHHLRELTYLVEQQQPWAEAMITLLLTIKAEVDAARAAGAASLDTVTKQGFTARYVQIVGEGLALEPSAAKPRPAGQRGRRKQSKAKNLLDRLQQHQDAVLAFMHDFRVPFDNNLAERDLRMLKVQQKVSGCFRSDEGATAFCRIRSYLSTLRKQGHALLGAITSIFTGSPLLPAFGAE